MLLSVTMSAIGGMPFAERPTMLPTKQVFDLRNATDTFGKSNSGSQMVPG